MDCRKGKDYTRWGEGISSKFDNPRVYQFFIILSTYLEESVIASVIRVNYFIDSICGWA